MDELSPLSIILVKKGGGGDRILFRYPYSSAKPTSSKRTQEASSPYSMRTKECEIEGKASAVGGGNSSWSCKETVELTGESLAEFPSNVLSSLFAVNPELCDSKFELKVNNVRFVGHPINLDISSTNEYLISGTPSLGKHHSDPIPSEDDNSSPLIMFHVVFAIMSSAKYSVAQCFHELCELIGNAIKSEERRTGYLTSESKILNQVQDEIANATLESEEFKGIYSPFQTALERSQLAKELKQIFIDVCHSGIVDVKINRFIEVSMCIPHKVHRRHHSNALVEPESLFQCLEALRPYHAMVLLYSEQELLDTLPLDGSPAMRKVIQYTTPLKSFRTLACDADLSLYQVFQIAGHLLYWGKATVIYPLCETNVYVVSPYTQNFFCNPVLDEEFADRFPGSSESLKTVLSWFSLPTSLSQLSPPHSLPGYQGHLARIIVWCLQRHILLQLHTYVTLALNENLDINIPDPVDKKKKRLERLFENEDRSLFTSLEIPSHHKDWSTDEFDKTLLSLSDNGNPYMCSSDQSLLMFTPEEREIIMKIPAAGNPEDLKLFIRLAGYFRGIYHIEEIMYHENLRRSQLLQVIAKFKSVLICHVQEDTAVTMYFNSIE